MTTLLFDCHLDETVTGALDPIWRSGRLASGASVSLLEARLGALVGERPVVAISDMTHALCLALRVAGVGPGDEVVTLAFNCMSSNSAITMVGAVPVWVDVDPETASIDVDDVRACITPRTRAVVVYHLAGYIGDIAALRTLCDEAGLPLVEDANNALGAEWRGKPIGSFGDYAVFSFYANRQLNGIEGAALVCRDEEAAERARRLRRFGIDVARFRDANGEIDAAVDVSEIGYSAILPNVNATLACRAMDDLTARIDRNRANVAYLAAALADQPGLQFIREHEGARGVFWVALVRSAARDRLMTGLKARDVNCSKLHQRNDVYSGFGARQRELPGTTILQHEMLALPSGWWLSRDDLERIIEAVRSVELDR
ncbi:DegT/DnrJ/EryC1/StrS family aminotransferase [Sphingomonas sp. SUN019]|uniref:DegT/DnrJ/EryC1/StrS family aminotransferase n=1 Tax=Sphingomonas sp. SUN019 TaxID=2937788 RepID=UPI0021641F4F|nr:DegT/DnrJ/EryC1/StrS family aminotransferase [Sphingomonas sp. SUN019]UVO50930.1 DegT/DnrJ/EryC1/StrS family aminotransferase [Sphingomonas sp. SUN019]